MRVEDQEAFFERLYKQYYQATIAFFVRFGFPVDKARDLAQETFLRVYRGMDRYRGDAKWTFIETTARNLAFNEIRYWSTQGRSAIEVSVDENPRLLGSLATNPWTNQKPPTPEEDLGEKEKEQEAERLRRRLRAEITKLPENLRSCLLLWLRGLKYRQIQTRLDLSMDAVKSRLHEARERLRESLGEEPGEIDWPAASEEDDHDQEK